MYNVDTVTLGYKVLEFTKKCNGILEENDIYRKILMKTWMDNKDKEAVTLFENYPIVGNQIVPVYKHAKYNGYSFTYNLTWGWLTVMIPHSKIEKYVTAEDIEEDARKNIIKYFELSESEDIDFELKRIDIKNDYKYADAVEYLIIKYIIKIATDRCYTYKKDILMDDERGYITTYSSKKTKYLQISENITVDYLNKLHEETSDYEEAELYDKEKEIMEKIKEGKKEEGELGKYIRVFRTEVRLKNAKLNSNKKKKMPKTLKYYYRGKVTKKIYSDFIKKIFGTNDFYRIDVALNIIKEQEKIRNTTKGKMCRLISMVNEKGYSKAKKTYVKQYSESTFRNMQKRIELLGINILTFPEIINGRNVDKQKIYNFTALENGVDDLIERNCGMSDTSRTLFSDYNEN